MSRNRFVLDFQEIDRSQIALVGGKGAHLGALARIDGVHVPPGFCVTTAAFQRIIVDAPSLSARLDRLSRLEPDEREAIRALSAAIRRSIDETSIPGDVAAEITAHLARLGEDAAYAVRSSATAEDLPTASFAGQQDTYLNVVGAASILRHISRCWASLFTERAVTYRLRNGIDQRKVQMAVVVQRMVLPQVSGILFTADPITGNRKVASVEASFGLGEALVSGLVNADVYTVRDGEVIARAIAAKQRAIVAVPGGGTQEQAIASEQQTQPALTDAQAVEIVALGRRIEAHFGRPQDIEWCLAGGAFQIVQSRPITTLFPVPAASDQENHVYISVGHQQMMTDPFRPLGLSFWQMMSPRPMAEAGGRLFVDVTKELASPASRANIMAVLGKSDPLIGDALQTIIDREGFLPVVPDDGPAWTLPGTSETPIATDPELVPLLIQHSEDAIAALQREIEPLSGSALLDFIQKDLQEMWRMQFEPRSMQVVLAGMAAAWWLNEHVQEWLGEKNVADTLTQSVPHNVTSEMGLALLEVADAIRPYPEVVAFLQQVERDDFLDALPRLRGGGEARAAILAWLERYGMRCAGEIDITRPRWSERPTALVPLILSNIRNFAPGEAQRRFAQGLQEALRKEAEVLERLRALPDGEQKAEETKQQIARVRTFAGYREYPKYGMVNRYFIFKQALLREADRLVQAGAIAEREDIFFLRFDELQEAVRTHQADSDLIRQRKEDFTSYQALTPPRVMTSNGEVITGVYRRDDLAPGALVGLPVSAGTIEGRARVILDMAQAALEPGDILVTAYTDPSWTPLFVTISGLVTEVGGLMTHGAVIAREYGLPAVVGVVDATRLIRDGQRIRVNGTEGFVEILD
ncbi:MAG: rifamycin-inactivating phosphotransferase [Thermomicrobiales bacterium]